MSATSDAYWWIGEMRPDGRPVRHLGSHDLPPENISPEATAQLTPMQVKAIKAHPDLYEGITERAWNGRTKDDPQPVEVEASDHPYAAQVDPAYLNTEDAASIEVDTEEAADSESSNPPADTVPPSGDQTGSGSPEPGKES